MSTKDKSVRPPLTALALRLPNLEASTLQALRTQSHFIAIAKGATIFAPGDSCQNLTLLTKGAIQVRITSEHGRELTLYRVSPGETCVMSVACLMGANHYQAEAIAETDIEGIAIGHATFDHLLATSPAFRSHILSIQTHRIFDLVGLVDEIAFHRTEARLASRLLALSASGGEIVETHQQLADDIGTAREVVSRRLKRLEARGLITVERRNIRINNRQALAQLAE
ncbi:MAG: Crp/Fnr family transcriptional regulator [Hyphomicrobiaceae bacterium]|nr:Crp/Fnr family transcriptional regulator [Hyphomicrobiaceae bacterium]